jgi:hypothetical protein
MPAIIKYERCPSKVLKLTELFIQSPKVQQTMPQDLPGAKFAPFGQEFLANEKRT